MTIALGTNWNVADENAVGDRIRALREALGMTQETLAAKSNGVFERVNVTRLERGYNAASSWMQRVGLSSAFGLSLLDVDAYLTGRLSLAEAVKRCGRSAESSEPAQPVVVPDDRYPARAQVLHAVRELLDAEALAEVRGDAHFGDVDPGPVYWLEEAIRAHKRVQLRRTSPETLRAEERKGSDAFAALAAKDTERAKAAQAKAREAAAEKKRRGER